ncbi:tRNA-dependent cyclodipeptide synthase [Streptomyces radiopugnans]|uniref:tRNA-dependent cyclodipeptide synthase n=1 Tax=Streptomyces radiopugnans TaxID=403935 RepID=UPI003F1DCD0F
MHENSCDPSRAGSPSGWSTGEFVATPLTRNCARVFYEGSHVLFGVSLGNSYFRIDVLCGLLRWLRERFQRIDFMIPDSAYRDGLVAAGRSPEYAEVKTRREASTARSRVLRAWRESGAASSAEGRVHLLSEMLEEDAYRSLRQRVEHALRYDAQLYETCLEMSRLALRSQMNGVVPTTEQATAGLSYLMAEMPFFVDSAEIFAVPSSVCFYHRPVPVADFLFSRRGLLRPSLRQGYALIRPGQFGSGNSDTSAEGVTCV